MPAGAAVLVLASGEHGHLDLGVSVGPLALRVALLAAVPVVAGFALLRGFLTEPDRRTTAAVVGTAAGAATLELLVSGGLNLPEQTVPLLLAALAVALYLVLSRDPRFAGTVGRARRHAGWVFWAAGALAAVQLAAAWLARAGPARTVTLLHTGVVLALVALAWFAVARPRGRIPVVALRAGAALLALVLVAGVARALVLRPADPTPGRATAAGVEVGPDTVRVLVVPNLPGWNLVHVDEPGVAVGTDPGRLALARPRPGTTGRWAAVELPAGRGALWVRHRGALGSLVTDTGSGPAGPAGLAGPDGPECASALLGRMLAAGPVTGARCPAETMDARDAEALRETIDLLATRGERRLALVLDQSPRARAAAEVVRAAAARRGIAAGAERAGGPLLVLSGWAGADRVLREVASGEPTAQATFLAPWLFSEPLSAIDAGQRIAQRFDPGDELFARYRADLRAGYPTQAAAAAGYRAWLAARLEPETGAVRLVPTDPAQATR